MKVKPVNVLGWPNTQAVLLTVPPFPMHIEDVRAFVAERRQMTVKAFNWAMLELRKVGFVKQARSLTGAVMRQHVLLDESKLRYGWRTPVKYAWQRSGQKRERKMAHE